MSDCGLWGIATLRLGCIGRRTPGESRPWHDSITLIISLTCSVGRCKRPAKRGSDTTACVLCDRLAQWYFDLLQRRQLLGGRVASTCVTGGRSDQRGSFDLSLQRVQALLGPLERPRLATGQGAELCHVHLGLLALR